MSQLGVGGVAAILDETSSRCPDYVSRLEAVGFSVRIVQPVSAQGALRRPAPAVVLLDVADPAGLVTDLCRAGARQPMVVMKGPSEHDVCLAAVAAGADDYIDHEFLSGDELARRLAVIYTRWRREVRTGDFERHLVKARVRYSISRTGLTVAHGLGQPLAVLHGNSTLVAEIAQQLASVLGELAATPHDRRGLHVLQSHRPAQLCEKLGSLAKENAASVDRIRGWLRQCQAFSRTPLEERVPIDVNALARLAARDVASEFDGRGRVDLELDAVPTIEGVPGALFQALLNIATNAVHASEGLSTDDKVISIKTATDGAEVVVSVADNGVGIPPDALNQVFVPFVSLRKPRLGLGLTEASHIVRQHRGRISVSSTPGEGSTFEIRLPHKAPRMVPPRRRPTTDKPHDQSRDEGSAYAAPNSDGLQ